MGRSISKRQREWLICFGAIVLCTLFYSVYHLRVYLSSDSTSSLLMADSMAQGNVLLKGWVQGTNNFVFSEIVFYAIGRLLGIPYAAMLHVLPGFFYAMLVGLLIYFALYRDESWGLSQRAKAVTAACIALVLGLVPISSAYTLLNANSHNNLYAWIVVCFFLMIRYLQSGKKGFLIGLFVVGTLMSFSEGVTSMVLFAPAGLFALSNLVLPKEKPPQVHRNLWIIAAICASFVCAKGMMMVVEHLGGVVTRGLPMALVSLGEIPSRIVGFLQQACVLFGCNLFAEPGLWNVLTDALLLLLMAGILIDLVVRTVRFRRQSAWDRILYLGAVVNIGACIVTNVVVFHRYIVPAFLFGTVLTMKSLAQLVRHVAAHRQGAWVRRAAGIVAAVSLCVITVSRVTRIAAQPKWGSDEQAVMQQIQQRGYGDGYGDFWCASVNAYMTGFETRVYPILARDGDQLVPYPELMHESWYRERDKHFVITLDPASGRVSNFVNDEVLLRILGQPDESFTQGCYRVYYWEKDISDAMAGIDA